jgi:hypothetical protein
VPEDDVVIAHMKGIMMTKTKKIQYKVLRDTREKVGKWDFNELEDTTLITGDYSLSGLEKSIFVIERKASTGELSGNITEKRFVNELKRLSKFNHAYIICEFNMDEIVSFPRGSKIPIHVWPKLRVSSAFILKKIIEFETTYNVKFIFAGDHAKAVVNALFTQMAGMYAEKLT